MYPASVFPTLTKCDTQTTWFERFLRGVELRIGSKYRPDQEISIEVMKLIMEKVEAAVKGEASILESRDLTKKGAYIMSYFVASLMWGRGFNYGFIRIAASNWKKEGRGPWLMW